MTNAMEGGKRIRELRVLAGLSQEMLAEEVERIGGKPFARATLAKIEAGRQALLVERAVPIAQALGCPISELLGMEIIDPLSARVLAALERAPEQQRERLVQMLEQMADLLEEGQGPPASRPPDRPGRRR